MPHCPQNGVWDAYRAEFPTFERTTYLNTCSLGALSRRSRAALDLLIEIGLEQIRAREIELVADLVSRSSAAGLALKLPRSLHEHAGIVLFPAAGPAAVVRALKAERIVVDFRPGHVRVSPSFYNTFDENAMGIDRLGPLLRHPATDVCLLAEEAKL